MKKILVLTPDLENIGGVANYYNALKLDNLEEVDYFYVNSAKKEKAIGKLFRIINRYIQFLILLSKKNYSLIHVNPSLDKKSFFRDAIFTFLSTLAGKETVIFFRGWDEKFEASIHQSFIKKKVFKNSFGKSKNFILLSEFFREKMQHLCPNLKDKKVWIETTVADDSFLDRLQLENKSNPPIVNFLFLARMVREKGIFIAMDAFKEIQSRFPERRFQFFVGGNGKDLTEAKNYAKQQNIPNIFFKGFVVGNDKGKLLLESHILLFPTYHGEGLPNTVLEAMLYGMPVISRINAGIPDVVEHGKNGLITTSNDPKVFADFVEILISDKDTFKNMVIENHTKAKNTYTSTMVRERLLKIYNQILN